jgi:hypothetical protein
MGSLYTMSHVLRRLGASREAFESEVRTALADTEGMEVAVKREDRALLGLR